MPHIYYIVNSHVSRSELTSLKRCVGHTEVALDFVHRLILTKGIKPARITILSPYAANAVHA